MCREGRVLECSQGCVEHRVQVPAELFGVDRLEVSPSFDHLRCRWSAAGQRPQFGDRLAALGDGHTFTAFHRMEDLAAMIAQIPHAHRPHSPTVSPVRRALVGDRLAMFVRPFAR